MMNSLPKAKASKTRIRLLGLERIEIFIECKGTIGALTWISERRRNIPHKPHQHVARCMSAG